MNWLMGDAGVRFAFVEKDTGWWCMTASLGNENGPGDNSGADRIIRIDPRVK